MSALAALTDLYELALCRDVVADTAATTATG
jgi:hypothetical protein